MTTQATIRIPVGGDGVILILHEDFVVPPTILRESVQRNNYYNVSFEQEKVIRIVIEIASIYTHSKLW